MRLSNLFTLALVFLLFLGCRREPETFSPERPLAIEVAKARSYYHADNIKKRLEKKGLQPYVVATDDSVEGGKWYKILVGAQKDSTELEAFRLELQSQLDLDSVAVVDYTQLQSEIDATPVSEITEKEKIEAELPNLHEEVYDVISKFPLSNMFYVKQMFVFRGPAEDENTKMFASVANVEMDLPRGVSAKRLLGLTRAFAEAVYEDNIYGDRVTLDILKLKPDHGIAVPPIGKAAFLPSSLSSTQQLSIANFFADLVLNTGEYLTESKTEITVPSFNTLVGYETVIEPSEGYFRTYLILVDETCQYVIFCQSTDRTQEELYTILSLAGKSQGMIEYEEFYNTFFTLPQELHPDDHFIGFYIDKIDWSYAKSKDYSKWSKLCVGHWSAKGLFYNEKKGPWSYGIFDLLTEENISSFKEFYGSDTGSGKEAITVYGTDGYFVSLLRMNWNTWESYRRPWEVNFTFDRYVSMVDNMEAGRLNKEELIERAHAFQFQKGGYRETEETAEEIATK